MAGRAGSMDDGAVSFAFAVVGHDEADVLALQVTHALEAAQPGDVVVYVDSASSDDSAAVAGALGVEVLHAPLGKGRAMAAAMATATTDYLCFLDADARRVDVNIAAHLRAEACRTRATMVVAAFVEPGRRRAVTTAIYDPLADALFPEVRASRPTKPLSGFRAVRTDLPLGTLPPGYGIEAHLNIEVPLAGGTIAGCDVGTFEGKVRDYTNLSAIASDVAAALLDAGVAHSRLALDRRAEWEGWLEPMAALVARRAAHPTVEDADELAALAARPCPPTGIEQIDAAPPVNAARGTAPRPVARR